MTKFYTGWGETSNLPPKMKEILPAIAAGLATDGYTLRTDGSYGATELLQQGVQDGELYLPFQGFNGKHSGLCDVSSEKLRSIAFSSCHKFGFKSPKAQKIVIAQIASLLGADGNSPSEFVLSYKYANGRSDYILNIAHEYQINVLEITNMNPHQLQQLCGAE